MEQEIWRCVTIKPFNKYYEVSNMGNVRSLDKIIKCKIGKGLRKGRKLKTYITNGYEFVSLCDKQKQKTCYVHILVASAFIPNPDKKPTVNHKFGNKLDNRASELEWATMSEQMKHAINIGLFIPKPPPKLGSGSDHAKSKSVIQYDLEGNIIAQYGSANEAKRVTGYNQMSISLSCKKKSIYKGFKWSYKK